MLFNSVQFLVFLPITVLIYYAVPTKFRNVWLLITSYYFYMSWNVVYALLILFSTVSTWFTAGFIQKYKERKNLVKVLLALGIAINILILFFYKYYDMFVQALSSLFGLIGVTLSFPILSLLLPVGISFYTFQAIGYSIDVYNKTIEHEKNFLNYALFVSFFPQLVAGPIERSKNLLPQFRVEQKISYDNLSIGGRLLLKGFFKKVVIADNFALVVDNFYDNFEIWPAPFALSAVFFFAVQLYCDFSAYSDIARGSARILGIKLMKNFDHPYISTSFSDFWRRWHISLSTWFKDYLYIPLGGNRKGKVRSYLNLAITFVVSGLWHGANITFVLWGILQAFLRLAESIFASFTSAKKRKNSTLSIFLKSVTVFVLWSLTLVYFRSPSLSVAHEIFATFFRGWGAIFIPETFIEQITIFMGGTYSLVGILIGITALGLLEFCEIKGKNEYEELMCDKPFALRWASYYLLMALIVVFGIFEQSAFVYFQF